MGSLEEEFSTKIVKPAAIRTYGSRAPKIPSNDDFKRFQSFSDDTFSSSSVKNQPNDDFDCINATTPTKSDLKIKPVSSTSSDSDNIPKKVVSSAKAPLVEKSVEPEVNFSLCLYF